MLAHEDTIAGGYDLMDIVALKVIERSRIKTRILKADTAILERVIKGGSGGDLDGKISGNPGLACALFL